MKKWMIILTFWTTLLMGGCSNFSETDVEKPIKQYLKEDYGFNGNIKILSTTDDSLNELPHDTYIQILHPYLSFIRLMLDYDTLEVEEEGSDDVYLQFFKGAYIEQNPNVIKFSNQIIKKYGLVKISDDTYDQQKQNYFYYLNVNIDYDQEQKLIEDFKKTQKINTNEIVPNVIQNDPNSNDINANYIGVINFNYQFDLSKNKNKIPNVQELFNEYKEHKVLNKGIYGITLYIMDTSGKAELSDFTHSQILFSVDAKGKYSIIPSTDNYPN